MCLMKSYNTNTIENDVLFNNSETHYVIIYFEMFFTMLRIRFIM